MLRKRLYRFSWGKTLFFPVNHPWITLIISIIFASILGLVSLDIRIDASPKRLLEGDPRSLATYELIEDAIKNQTVILISMECDDPFSPDNLRTIWKIGEIFMRKDGVIDVKSITHAALPYRDGFTFKFKSFLPSRWTAENLAETREFSLKHPLVRNILVSGDGHNAIIAVTYDPDFFSDPLHRDTLQKDLDDILAPFSNPNRSFRSISAPQSEVELQQTFINDLRRFSTVFLSFLVICLLVFFRSLRLIIYLVTLLLTETVMLIGITSYSGIGITSLALFPLLLAVEITLLAHVSRTFVRLLAKTGNVKRSVKICIITSWRSCLFATLTTTAALLSLLSADMEEANFFGITGAIGVILGLILVFGPGMSILTLLFKYSHRKKSVRDFALSPIISKQTALRRKTMIFATLFLIITALPGIIKLTPDIQITHMLPEKSYTRRMADDFERIYEGRNFLQITIESNRRNGACGHTFLAYILDIQDFAGKLQNVTGTYSFASIMAMANQVWNNWEEGSFSLPDPILLNLFSGLLRAQAFPFTDVLADDDWSACNLYVRTSDMPSREYLALVEKIRRYAEEKLPEETEMTIGAGLHDFLQADQRIRSAQIKSGITAWIAVGLVLLLLWRSVKLALLASALTGIPIILTCAFAGYTGTPLNAVTFTVAAIVAGIAVDDIVHFITYWQQIAKRDEKNAVKETVRAKCPPIIFTSILLIGLFASFTLTSFPPAIDFGTLTAFAFAASLAAVLLLLPQLLPHDKQ